MTTLLVMTVGQTDVQLVENDQRHKLDGNICGTLHDAIKERSWSVIDAPSTRSRDFITEETLPEGDLTLCTPKLDAVLAHFVESPPSLALIFETNRQGPGDPRMAGEVMECRLRNRGVSQVARVAFLTGNERLEDPTNDPDAVVRRAVVATLSNAIGEQVKALTKDDQVVVATTGGLSAANDLINELTRLHAVGGPSVTALEVPDGNRANQGERAVEEKFHPAAGYRARWHALSLIQRGHLLSAWGAVSHLECASDQAWVQTIDWLRCFASSLPMPLSWNNEIPILIHDKMAVRAALRVELALRAGDVPRAVHGTVAFFEAALWDWLPGYDFNQLDGVRGSIEHGFTFEADRCPNKLKNLFKEDWHKTKNCSESHQSPNKLEKLSKQERKRKKIYRVNDFNKGVKAWLPLLKKDKLSKFWNALIKHEIHDLRNDVAHNEPTTSLVESAKRKMVDAELWSEEDTFLSQPLVQKVLCELGVEHPEKLAEDLINEVRRRLLSVEHK